jgi:hypothetical protein
MQATSTMGSRMARRGEISKAMFAPRSIYLATRSGAELILTTRANQTTSHRTTLAVSKDRMPAEMQLDVSKRADKGHY